jgi:NAD(P)-dependent dehydrogenase (short-subunit alcohol dehydrogenase family)
MIESPSPSASNTASVALITGASRGIGRALALEFARRGVHVIALARTVGALEELDDTIRALPQNTANTQGATLVPVDVTDYDALDRLGASIYERWGKLDFFIGNAAQLGAISPLAHTDQKTWDQVINTNLTANWRLLRSVDALLQAAPRAWAAFITSSVAQSCRAYWGPYAVSKAGLEALAKLYAAETTTTSIHTVLANPGALRTNMRKAAFPGEDASLLNTPDDFAAALVDLLMGDTLKTSSFFDYPQQTLSPF